MGNLSSSFTAAPLSGLAPLTVKFTDTSSGMTGLTQSAPPTSWKWDFGDGGTSTEQNPSHTFQKPGTYAVTLKVSNQYYTDQVSSAVTIIGNTISYYVSISVSGNATTTYGTSAILGGSQTVIENVGNAVKFVGFATPVDSRNACDWPPCPPQIPVKPVNKMDWNFGDNSTASPPTSIATNKVSYSSTTTHVYNSPGIYKVTLTASTGEITSDPTFVAYIDVRSSTGAPASVPVPTPAPAPGLPPTTCSSDCLTAKANVAKFCTTGCIEKMDNVTRIEGFAQSGFDWLIMILILLFITAVIFDYYNKNITEK